ncbi:hypothetical protein HIR72_02015 [Pasteurella multocida]|uniref:hypothetical protein n=1 Tax=Pasteurella multocida TaxID=747 RepID=UPI0014615A7F|nr:hypothetical protein [Pasteurella multocida]NMR59469.1 hypothetical protein [Pasteurella multocida]
MKEQHGEKIIEEAKRKEYLEGNELEKEKEGIGEGTENGVKKGDKKNKEKESN